MKIVATASGFVRRDLASGKKATAELVRTFLVDGVNWGAGSCPDVAAVGRHMVNWAAIENNSRAKNLIDAAGQRWGRGNMLDFPTKLALIVGKTDSYSIGFVVESLFVDMSRKNVADPYGTKELAKVIGEILRGRSYMKATVAKHNEVFKPTSSAGSGLYQPVVMQSMVDQPHAFFLKTEGPDRDPTWLQSLPTEAHRLFMKHIGDISKGYYKSEIGGFLAAVGADKFNWEKFNKSSRVSARFNTPFSIAYDSLVSKPASASDLPEIPQPGMRMMVLELRLHQPGKKLTA